MEVSKKDGELLSSAPKRRGNEPTELRIVLKPSSLDGVSFMRRENEGITEANEKIGESVNNEGNCFLNSRNDLPEDQLAALSEEEDDTHFSQLLQDVPEDSNDMFRREKQGNNDENIRNEDHLFSKAVMIYKETQTDPMDYYGFGAPSPSKKAKKLKDFGLPKEIRVKDRLLKKVLTAHERIYQRACKFTFTVSEKGQSLYKFEELCEEEDDGLVEASGSREDGMEIIEEGEVGEDSNPRKDLQKHILERITELEKDITCHIVETKHRGELHLRSLRETKLLVTLLHRTE